MSCTVLSDSEVVALTVPDDATVAERPRGSRWWRPRPAAGDGPAPTPPPRLRPAAAAEPTTAARALRPETIHALFELEPRFHGCVLRALEGLAPFHDQLSPPLGALICGQGIDEELLTAVRLPESTEGALPRSRVTFLEDTDLATRPPSLKARARRAWLRADSLVRTHSTLAAVAIGPMLVVGLVAMWGGEDAERARPGHVVGGPAVSEALAAHSEEHVTVPPPSLDARPLPGTTDVLVLLGSSPVDVPDLGEGGPHDFVAMMDGRLSARGSIPAHTSFGGSKGAAPGPLELRLTLPPMDGVARAVPPAVLAEGRSTTHGSRVRVVTSPPGAQVYVRVRAVLLGLPEQSSLRNGEHRPPAGRMERARAPIAPPPAVAPEVVPPTHRERPVGPLPNNPY